MYHPSMYKSDVILFLLDNFMHSSNAAEHVLIIIYVYISHECVYYLLYVNA